MQESLSGLRDAMEEEKEQGNAEEPHGLPFPELLGLKEPKILPSTNSFKC